MLQQWKTCLSGQELGWVCTRTHTANLYGEILRLFCWYKKLQKTDLKPPTDVYMSGNKWKHLKWNYILFTHLGKKPKQSLYSFNFHFVICLSGVCYTGVCLCSFVDLGVWSLTDMAVLTVKSSVRLWLNRWNCFFFFIFTNYIANCIGQRACSKLVWQRRSFASKVAPFQGMLKLF